MTNHNILVHRVLCILLVVGHFSGGVLADISTTAEVKCSQPNLDDLRGIVGKLQADLTSVKSELEFQVQTIAALNSTVAALNSTNAAQTSTISALNVTTAEMNRDFNDQLENKTNLIADLQIKLDQQEKQASDLLKVMFIKSQTYNGRHYLLSHLYIEGMGLAEYWCNRGQGYLVEIDDQSEYQFIESFLDPLSHHPYITVGAIKDDQSGGQWVFYHSRRPVTYFQWDTEETMARGNCTGMYIKKVASPTWLMYRQSGEISLPGPFLCEVPEN